MMEGYIILFCGSRIDHRLFCLAFVNSILECIAYGRSNNVPVYNFVCVVTMGLMTGGSGFDS